MDYPNVADMQVPYTWIEIEVILDGNSSDMVSLRDDLHQKAEDSGYGSIFNSIQVQGLLDPLYVGDCSEYYCNGCTEEGAEEGSYGDGSHTQINNGHHRLLALMELGYKFAPVTDNSEHGWRRSGPQC